MRSPTSSIGALLEGSPRLRAVVESAYWRLGALLFGGKRTVRVGEVSARYGLSTRAEYLRAKSLGGERAVLEALLGELEGDETVWDVGAGVGTYTCLLANALDSGRVVGFEPEPTNGARLRANLVCNAPGERFAVSGVALWDRDGETTLASEGDPESTEAGEGHHYLSADGEGRVEARRGASLVESGLAPPDVLKIDVQGGELQVLRGMGAVIGDVRTIYLEVHPEKCERYGTTAVQVEGFLRDAGFSLARIGTPTTGRGGVYFLRAHR
jgi:FkbM family methyltransferase